MLAVSEECRHDVYEMIEMAQLLEQGFETRGRQGSRSLTGLSSAQRVLDASAMSPAAVYRAARSRRCSRAAAAVAFAVAHPGAQWQCSKTGRAPSGDAGFQPDDAMSMAAS